MNWGKVTSVFVLFVLVLSLVSCASPGQPLGGLMHRYDDTTPAGVQGKTEFYLRIDQGQRVAIAVIPDSTVMYHFTLWGPGADKVLDASNRKVDWYASNPGDYYLNQNFVTNDGGGTFKVEGRSLSGQGNVRFLAIPQGTIEEEIVCQCGNNDLASAQGLDGNFWNTAPGTSRAAVYGELPGQGDVDFYKFSAKAGETFSLTAASDQPVAPGIELYDAGASVATGVLFPESHLQRIDTYTVKADTTLAVKVTGEPNTNYGVVIVRNGVVEKEGNHAPATAMLLPGDDGSPNKVLSGQKSIYGATGELVFRDPSTPANEPKSHFELNPFIMDINPATGVYTVAPSTTTGGIQYKGAPYIQLVDLMQDGTTVAPLDSFSVSFDEDGYVENGVPSPTGQQIFHNTPAAGQLTFESLQMKTGSQQILSSYSTDAALYVTREISWREGQNYIQVTHLFKNTNDKAMKNVSFMETYDPAPGGDRMTHNYYRETGMDHSITSWNDKGALLLGSVDPRVYFAIGVAGDTSLDPTGASKDVIDPRAVIDSENRLGIGSCNMVDPCPPATDQAISVAFDIGTLPARSLTAVTYVLAFGDDWNKVWDAYGKANPASLQDAPIDEYSLPLLPGQYVEMYTRTPGSPDATPYNVLNTALRLMGPDGSQFAFNDDYGGTSDSRLAFTVGANQAGRYVLRVEPALTGRQSTEPKYVNGGEYVLNVVVYNPPKFRPVAEQPIKRGETLTVAATADDADLPNDTLTYSLVQAPQGATIDAKTGVITWAVPADKALGKYPVRVQVKDTTKPAALTDTLTFNISVRLDTTPPQTQINTRPAAVTTSHSATFTFEGADNLTPAQDLTYECKIDQGEFQACATTVSVDSLTSGKHTFTVRSIDADGNIESVPPSYDWLVEYQTYIPITIAP